MVTKLTPEEIEAYHAGYDENEGFGPLNDFKNHSKMLDLQSTRKMNEKHLSTYIRAEVGRSNKHVFVPLYKKTCVLRAAACMACRIAQQSQS